SDVCSSDLFSVSDVSSFIGYYLNTTQALDIYYTIGNTLYIVAYILLIFEVVKRLNFKKVIKIYKLHLLVLGLLNVYIIYMLLNIVDPVFSNSYLMYVELIYNVVMLLLLSFALIAYFYIDSKRSLLFFLVHCVLFFLSLYK